MPVILKIRFLIYMYAHLREQDFHCAHTVFQRLPFTMPLGQALFDATAAYLGGTLLQGMTCSAFTAGVMAIGLRIGEIENSYGRVLRMLAKGMDIADESINKFHRVINLGHRLSEWFVAAYGSTQCRAITRCDFASTTDEDQYIANNGIMACRTIAHRVAEQTQNIIEEAKQEF